mmetsp:Transcript_37784/g.73790  ORF Transcript_37784/g.73790 Transcript_37784/m.73790 type:complete len:153 (+) Transcript_37784:1-459(+)
MRENHAKEVAELKAEAERRGNAQSDALDKQEKLLRKEALEASTEVRCLEAELTTVKRGIEVASMGRFNELKEREKSISATIRDCRERAENASALLWLNVEGRKAASRVGKAGAEEAPPAALMNAFRRDKALRQMVFDAAGGELKHLLGAACS